MTTRTPLRPLSVLKSHCRYYSARATSPHPALVTLPFFLSTSQHDLLLSHSLRLLDSPARTTAAARKKRREWVKAHPGWNAGRDGTGALGGGAARAARFLPDEATLWEEGHFDGVIKLYREMLVREGQWGDEAREGTPLAAALDKVYSLLPPPASSSGPPSPSSTSPRPSPPDHLILHLLHLSSRGSIAPHVDNLDAFGRTIAGVSLGGERVMRFKQVSDPGEDVAPALREGPREFEVLLEAGSAYVQSEPLRTHYTHEVLETATWDGRRVGGTQRLSLMLRDEERFRKQFSSFLEDDISSEDIEDMYREAHEKIREDPSYTKTDKADLAS
ncbi:hypothetical protein JCM8208_006452 [Rhodotorula glutinis]